MNFARKRMFGAAVVGVSLVAAACGGSSSGGGAATGGTIDESVKKGVDDILNSTTTTAAGGATATTTAAAKPTSMAEWTALSTKQREAMVKAIKDAKAGKSADGKSVTGTNGFTIDLSKCPAGWSDSNGGRF